MRGLEYSAGVVTGITTDDRVDVSNQVPFQLDATSIADCYVIRPRLRRDERGLFVKVFQRSAFAQLGLRSDFVEEYYSVSAHRVLRGLHCQLPPHDHAKLVYCVAGKVMDVGLDLRRKSTTYGHHVAFELSENDGAVLYLPPGIAHGFYVRSAGATLLYKVTSEYAPNHDSGIRWNSAGIEWPDESPVVSERDSRLPALKEFDSPF